MKKKIFFIVSLIFLILGFLFYFFPFGIKKYEVSNSSVTLDMPKLATVIDEDDNSIKLKFFRSKFSLKKDIKKIMDSYNTYYCNNSEVYYNKKNNVTIKSFKINSSFVFNELEINFEKGKISNNDCSVVKNFKKTDYSVKDCPGEFCYGTNHFYYQDENGKVYNLYYNYSKFLLFKTGNEKYNYLTSMLKYSWISMKDVINFLEFQSKNGNTIKQIDENGMYIKYYNKDFILIQCTSDNKDIYLEDYSSLEKNNFCN